MLLGSAVTLSLLRTDPRYEKADIITPKMLSSYALEQRSATDAEVMKVLNGMKDEYGVGASTLIRIFNASGERLFLRSDFHLRGNTWKYPFDTIIENGQWSLALVVHTGNMEGVAGGVVYHTATADLYCGWDVPYFDGAIRGHKNTVYCEIQKPGYWDKQAQRDDVHKKTNKGAASFKASGPEAGDAGPAAYRVSVLTAAGTSPITDITIGRTDTLR